MLWLFAALAILITPLEAHLTLTHELHTAGQLLLRIWGIPLRQRFHVQRTGRGHQLILDGRHPQSFEPRGDQLRSAMSLLGAFLRSDHARRFLFRQVELRRLALSLHLCLDNAARTAMLTGFVRTVYTSLPPRWREKVRIQVAPDFLRDHSALRGQCILFTRLGTLVITAAMLLIAWMLERREHRSDRPKEETA